MEQGRPEAIASSGPCQRQHCIALWFISLKEVQEVRRREGAAGSKTGESLATGMERCLRVWGWILGLSTLFPSSFTTKCIPSGMGLPSRSDPLG